jgi:arabinose-5-phosphate isomerase
MLSQSGETEEVVRLLPSLTQLGAAIIAITARRTSTLGRAASVVIELGPLKEACSLGLAPSTSTTAMLGLGDALALVTSRMRSFGRDDFARFHPGGSLGLQLAKVDDHMRLLDECRVARCSQSVREVLIASRAPGRRSGAIMVIDPANVLRGIFTDSDLARLFESRRDDLLDGPIRAVMTRRPTTVPLGSMMVDAVEVMAERKISELPVVDADGQPQGMLDITDIVSLFPQTDFAAKSTQSETLPIPPPKSRKFSHPGRTSADGRA